jgi:cytochrome c oxidase subunit III
VHHPALQHQFETMGQQKEAAVLGMWAFLLTEILFFGGLFMAYMLYRIWYHDAFVAASTSIDLKWGALNTVVLIGSSLTMALAVRAAQTNQRKATVNWLIVTMILGTVFLGVKVIEYADKFAHHHVPGPNFVWAEPGHEVASGAAEGTAVAAEDHALSAGEAADLQNYTQIFFSLYFTMTGLHALHMIIGVALLATIAWMAWKGRFSSEYYTPVEMSGLYWHFVDIVWIYLFPLLYLIDRS